MNGTKSSRPIPLALTMLVAFFAALTALAVSNGHDAHAHGNPAVHAEHASASQAALRSDMRVLWEDHITWTRLAIISLTTGSPDTTATVGRLLKNQTDIGNAVKPFYGKAAGNALTAELRKHILIAADVVASARKGTFGHGMGAAGGWELTAQYLGVAQRKIFPTTLSENEVHASIRAALPNLVLEHAVELSPRAVGKMSIGVGGINACVISRPYPPRGERA